MLLQQLTRRKYNQIYIQNKDVKLTLAKSPAGAG
jgi:hypothetical protein